MKLIRLANIALASGLGLTVVLGDTPLNPQGSRVNERVRIAPLIANVTAVAPTGPLKFFVRLSGKKQGVFKGETTLDRHKDWIELIGFESSLASPRDVATGMASGKRMHKPITIVKEWGAASPQLFSAAINGEILDTVEIFVVKEGGDGETPVATFKLSDASISSYSNGLEENAGKGSLITRCEFTYRRLEMIDSLNKMSVIDDWQGAGL